ncbi:MAG: PAS domain S-box protein [Spirochaetes bacterium]|jgi:PAS domain S-box-containing protein|nr:PAS domain S-box protein [Spirochaetota bacterium]
MELVQAALWALCGVCALSGGISALVSLRFRSPGLYRAHALMCAGIIVYIACNARLYGITSLDDYYAVSRVRMYGTAVFHVALLVFAGAYTGLRLRPFSIAAAVVFAGFTAARHLSPPFLDSAVHGIALRPLPWGGHIAMIDLAPGAAFIAYQALVITTYLVVFLAAAVQYRRGQRRKAVLLSAGALVLFMSLVHDTVVFNLSLSWLMLSEAGFTGIVLLVGLVISDELVHSATLSDRVAAGERRFHAIFNSTFQFIGLLDRSGRIIEVNQSALVLIGQSIDHIRGLRIWEAPWWRELGDERSALRDAVKRSAAGEFMRLALRHIPKGGGVAHFDFSLKPVFDSEGSVELIIAEGRDVSEIRDAAETITRKNEELAAVNEELTASIEELEASNEAFEEQNRELVTAQEDLRSKEAEMRRLVENAPAVIYRQSLPDGRLSFIGGRCADIFGYTSAELLENPEYFDHLLEFDWREYLRKAWNYINRGMDPPTVEYSITNKSGESKWLSQRSLFVRDERGEPVALEGIIFDITARRIAEEALQRSEYYLGSILRGTPDIIYRLDPLGTIIYINEAVKKYGYEPADVIGTSLFDYVHPEDIGIARYRINERRTGGRATRFLELRLFTPISGTVHVEYSASAIHATPVFHIHAEGLYDCPLPEPGAFIGTQGIARDITERHLLEKTLGESADRFRVLIESSPLPILLAREGRLIFVNDTFRRLAHLEDGESVEGLNLLEFIAPERRKQVGEYIRARLSGEDAPSNYESIGLRRDGSTFPYEISVATVELPDGPATLAYVRDISERKTADAALAETLDNLRRSQEIAHVGNWRLDIATNTFCVSDEGARIWGFPPGQHPSFEEVSRRIHPEDRDRIAGVIEGVIKRGEPYSVEYRISHRDTKELRHIHAMGELQKDNDGNPRSVFGILQDITESRRIQEEKEKIQAQLIQAQKMEAVGTLAGGIAHDFNNLLGGIMGSLSLLELMLEDEPIDRREKIKEFIDTALEASRRAAEMIRRLLAVSSRAEMRMGPVDLNIPLKNVRNICRNSFPKSVRLVFHYSDTPLYVSADISQIEQVFLNLCLNASHAMSIMRPPGESEGGTLTVTLSTANGDPPGPGGSNGAPRARIRFEDTGVGMDEEVSLRIFEPFYTTKRKENGTGLGLSVAYGIIEQHGGHILMKTKKGQGSTFDVYLPLIEQRAPAGRADGFGNAMVRGTGRILIIDDERAILNVARGILSACGYQVLTASGGEEGIALYSSNGENINAVLLDMSMPGLSGLEILERLFAIDPEVRVLLSSGFAEDERVRTARGRGVRGFIQKPYTAAELSQKISEILT